MRENKRKIKVLIALSGGVDSSVAAALLVSSKKYDVTAAFMINYDDRNHESRIMNQESSCWLPDYRDAVRVAAKLGIPILKLNFTKEYNDKVLSYMYSEYEKGRTPNPDVMCNSFIKFGSWLQKAKELGFDYIATGHYASIERRDLTHALSFEERENDASFSSKEKARMRSSVRLLQSKDDNKDQTYFLHQLTQDQLAHTLFPIGKYIKPQVRKLAEKFDLPTAEKEESMGICFIGEVPMKEFLQKRIAPKPGNIIFDGNVIGQHEGLAFYTIGERHIGVQSQKSKVKSPVYVVGKNLKTNELVVGYETNPLLYKKECEIEKVNWISGQEPKFPLKCEVRLRHRQPLQKCRIKNEELRIKVEFEKPQRAVTPGQFAVFYKKGECLGGGVIEN